MVERNTVINGDCIEVMKEMPKDSVDSVVTDPPYNFDGGFMGKEWDDLGEPKQYQKWCERWGKQCLRVLKPGGYILAFSGTHSFHRLAVGLEDAGFDIKTTMMWLYGSGFPKSHNISKAIDKMKGKEREVVDIDIEKSGWKAQDKKNEKHGFRPNRYYDDEPDEIEITAPATPEAERWSGWGTSIKPAFEPIVLAQKPKQDTGTIVINKENLSVLECECDNDGE